MRDRAASAAYRRTKREERPEGQLARGLGWFEHRRRCRAGACATAVGRLTGMPIPPALMMLCGLREVACGIGILTQPKAVALGERPDRGRRTGPRGSRSGIRHSGPRSQAARSGRCRGRGITALDRLLRARRSPRASGACRFTSRRASSSSVRPTSFTASGATSENLPQRHAAPAIGGRPLEDNRSHWVSHAPWGGRIEWDFRADRRSAGAAARVAHGGRFGRVQCGFGALHADRGRRLYRSHGRSCFTCRRRARWGRRWRGSSARMRARTCSRTSPRSSASWKREALVRTSP